MEIVLGDLPQPQVRIRWGNGTTRGWHGNAAASGHVCAGEAGRGFQQVFQGSLEDNLPAARAGLREGDVIVGINRQAIRNAKDCEDAISALPSGSRALVQVIREGQRLFAVLSMR